jgi:hypothetical protein
MGRLSSAELTDGLFFDLDESLTHFRAVSLAEVQSIAQTMFSSPRSFIAVGDLKPDVFAKFN